MLESVQHRTTHSSVPSGCRPPDARPSWTVISPPSTVPPAATRAREPRAHSRRTRISSQPVCKEAESCFVNMSPYRGRRTSQSCSRTSEVLCPGVLGNLREQFLLGSHARSWTCRGRRRHHRRRRRRSLRHNRARITSTRRQHAGRAPHEDRDRRDTQQSSHAQDHIGQMGHLVAPSVGLWRTIAVRQRRRGHLHPASSRPRQRENLTHFAREGSAGSLFANRTFGRILHAFSAVGMETQPCATAPLWEEPCHVTS